jgi:hypothetical protein
LKNRRFGEFTFPDFQLRALGAFAKVVAIPLTEFWVGVSLLYIGEFIG